MTRLLVSVALLLTLNSSAQAQTNWASVFAEAQCNGTLVDVTVDMYVSVTNPVPDGEVGWVVKRRVVGACVPEVQVGVVHAYVPGQNTFVIQDRPLIENRKTIYYIMARDENGNEQTVSWPQRTNFAQTDCGGPAARGVVTEPYPGGYYLEVCQDQCWWMMSMFDNHLPPEAPALVGQTIDVYGDLTAGLEGPYIVVDHWTPGNCSNPVGSGKRSWGQIKGRFR